MVVVVENSLEPRKEWAKPELKKVDIEQITAAAAGHGHDGHAPSSKS